eukprot:jgi/Botrbrau1/12062/Bobra.0295s0017.1
MWTTKCSVTFFLVMFGAQCSQELSSASTFILRIFPAPAHQSAPELPSASELGNRPYDQEEALEAQRRILKMFYHGYDSYITYAFPHDELKPLTKTYTDSLGELGNLNREYLNSSYQGVAMTLIDSLSSLAVLGNRSEFAKNVNWLARHMTFDMDVRVNVFEANIRLLGGLLSGHLLAEDPRFGGLPDYQGELLDLAYELGLRLLPAFLESPTGLPYAWVNLKKGVVEEARSVAETNTAAVGSLTIEMTVLSRLTGVPVFEEAARRSLRKLWRMRSHLGLFGTALNMLTAEWIPPVHGTIGASSDSFYEYLLKAFVLFGDEEYWEMFVEAYVSAVQHYKRDGWYQDSDIFSGQPTHQQFTSLQGFWPGMQVMVGDVAASRRTFERFFSVVQQYKLPPERYLFNTGQIHPTEHYYPLRPELIESAYYLYQATREPYLQRAGQFMLDSLYKYAWAEGGLASIRSVNSMEQEDYMPSFFLAETCKYLFLLFNDTLRGGNYVLTTEGHPIPVAAVRQARPSKLPRRRTAATLATHPAYAGANFQLALQIARGHTIFKDGLPAVRCPLTNCTQAPQARAQPSDVQSSAEQGAPSLIMDGHVIENIEGHTAAPAALLAALQNVLGSEAIASESVVEVVLDDFLSGMNTRSTQTDGTGVEADLVSVEAAMASLEAGAVSVEGLVGALVASAGAVQGADSERYRRRAPTENAGSFLEAAQDTGPEPYSDQAQSDGAGSVDAVHGSSPREGKDRRRGPPCQGGGGSVGGSSAGSGTPEAPEEAAPCMKAGGVPWYPDWGLMSSGVSALEARVCPVPPQDRSPKVPEVQSLCHILDRWPDHSCRRDRDCGVDGDTCRRRRCTQFQFCQAF